MGRGRTRTPACLRRAFLLAGLTFVGAGFAGQPPTSAPELAQIGKPNPAEAARLLEQFRNSGLPGEYFLEFQLQTLPRRGPTKVFQGRLWGGRNEQGAVTRVELRDAEGRVHRFLLQNGARAAVWRLEAGRSVPVDGEALFRPLIPGVEVTPFDLQMPYLYWPDAVLQSINRVRGRPAHAFMFRPPEALGARLGELAAVRAYLDTQYNALMQAEHLGNNGRVLKSFSLVSLKTIDGQPLPKSVDFRNEVTRDKTRLLVTGAALRLDLGAALFDPAVLADEVRPPAGIVKVD